MKSVLYRFRVHLNRNKSQGSGLPRRRRLLNHRKLLPPLELPALSHSALSQMVQAGQRRADAGGQPDAGPNTLNPMGSGCGGYSTLTICAQRRQQPPQLSHNYRLTAHAGNCLDRIANELENKLLQLFRLLGARRFAAKTIQPRTTPPATVSIDDMGFRC